MNITQEQIAENHVKVIVNLEPQDYLQQVNDEIKSLSRKISIDGFRPGKVPPGITRKLYGNSVLVEELNKIVGKSVEHFISEQQLKLFGQPLPVHIRDQHLDVMVPETFSFGFEIGLMPRFEVFSLEGKKFTRRILEVTPEKIEEEIKHIRQKTGTRTYPEEAAATDVFVGKWQELNDSGELKEGGIEQESSFSLELIKDPVSRELLLNLKKEESTDLAILPAFGNDRELVIHQILHTDHHQADVMNNRFRFSLNRIVRVEPAELNQKLYDDYFGADVVHSEEELRQRVEHALIKEFQSVSESRLDREIQDTLIRETSIALPMEYLRRLLNESRKEDQPPVTEEQLEASANQLRWDMLFEKIAADSHLTASEEDIRNEAARDVRSYFGWSDSTGEENQEVLDSLINRVLQDEKSADRLKNRALNQKVFALLRSRVTVEEIKVSEHEFFHH